MVAMIVDMRDSTRLAATRLPFDAVFVVDRFVTAVGTAVQESGGRISSFLGDGVMASFGLTCDPREACRQAIAALGAIGGRVAALNQVLEAETGEGIRFGIGMHCGSVVVGDIGYGPIRVFTSLGDAPNIAARLESLCKEFGCEAIVSADVWSTAQITPPEGSQQELLVRGQTTPLSVHCLFGIAVHGFGRSP